MQHVRVDRRDRRRDGRRPLPEPLARGLGSWPWRSTRTTSSSPTLPGPRSRWTLSSAASSRRSSAGICCQPGAETRARPSGWRVLTPDAGTGGTTELDETTHRAPSAARSSTSTAVVVDAGPVGEVDRVRRRRRGGTDEVLPDALGDERGERCHHQGECRERLVQGPQRGRVTVPEATTRAPHVPVGELVDEGRDVRRPRPRRRSRRGRRRPHAASCWVRETSQRSISGRVGRCSGQSARRRPAGQPCVEHLEGHGVPVGQQRLAHDLLDRLVADPSRRPR